MHWLYTDEWECHEQNTKLKKIMFVGVWILIEINEFKKNILDVTRNRYNDNFCTILRDSNWNWEQNFLSSSIETKNLAILDVCRSIGNIVISNFFFFFLTKMEISNLSLENYWEFFHDFGPISLFIFLLLLFPFFFSRHKLNKLHRINYKKKVWEFYHQFSMSFC